MRFMAWIEHDNECVVYQMAIGYQIALLCSAIEYVEFSWFERTSDSPEIAASPRLQMQFTFGQSSKNI